MKKDYQIFIVNCLANANVTSHNFDVIKKACAQLNTIIHDLDNVKDAIKEGSKQDIYIATTIFDVLKLYYSGRKNIYFWVQGILPEESLMRHSSKLRYGILSFWEKKSLKCAKHIACVSDAMREHYENKYNLNLKNKYSVFPCYNTTINEESFSDPMKYLNNVFVYAGGLAVWQCFEKTLDIYKSIENLGVPNTKLIVLTKDKEQAKKLILEKDIKNYETGFYPKEELPKVLSGAKFGFVIREDNPVNNVATPTKISTYLSCGLIPVYSSCIRAFDEQSKTMKYKVAWCNDYDIVKIKDMMKNAPDNNDVKTEYKDFFNQYYSNERHIETISKVLKEML